MIDGGGDRADPDHGGSTDRSAVQFVFGFAGGGRAWSCCSVRSRPPTTRREARAGDPAHPLVPVTAQLRWALLAEFAALGLVAGVLAGGAHGHRLGAGHFVFKLSHVPSGCHCWRGLLAGCAVVTLAGWLAPATCFYRPPLASLRALNQAAAQCRDILRAMNTDAAFPLIFLLPLPLVLAVLWLLVQIGRLGRRVDRRSDRAAVRLAAGEGVAGHVRGRKRPGHRSGGRRGG